MFNIQLGGLFGAFWVFLRRVWIQEFRFDWKAKTCLVAATPWLLSLRVGVFSVFPDSFLFVFGGWISTLRAKRSRSKSLGFRKRLDFR